MPKNICYDDVSCNDICHKKNKSVVIELYADPEENGFLSLTKMESTITFIKDITIYLEKNKQIIPNSIECWQKKPGRYGEILYYFAFNVKMMVRA